jgi:hypothetical protein
MYIYKITVAPINQVYIGFDSSPSYKLRRWKKHCKDASLESRIKLHKAIGEHGIENCNVEVLEDNFESIVDLALAEIMYIKKYDSYKNGLNSSVGGDGIGRHDLAKLTVKDIELIKFALGESFKDYNINEKWKDTTTEERKSMTAHLHTDEVQVKKSNTLKSFYNHNPEVKKQKGVAIKNWQEENKELMKESNRKNSLLGAAKISKKIIAWDSNNVLYEYASKSDFFRKTGLRANTVIEKTKKGIFYNGYKAKEA